MDSMCIFNVLSYTGTQIGIKTKFTSARNIPLTINNRLVYTIYNTVVCFVRMDRPQNVLISFTYLNVNIDYIMRQKIYVSNFRHTIEGIFLI